MLRIRQSILLPVVCSLSIYIHVAQAVQASVQTGPYRVTVRSVGSCVTLDVTEANVVRDVTTGELLSAKLMTAACDGRDAQDLVYVTDAAGATLPQHLVFQSMGDNFQGESACVQYDESLSTVLASACDDTNVNQKWQVTNDGSFYLQVVTGGTPSNMCLTRDPVADSLSVKTCGDATVADPNDQRFDFTGVTVPGIAGQAGHGDDILNFAATLHSTQVVLSASDNPSIQVSYMYGGTTNDTVFRYKLYPYDGCGKLDDPPLVGYDATTGLPDQTQAIYLDVAQGTSGFTMDAANGTLSVHLGIRLQDLEASQFWQHAADNPNMAHLKFCARLEIIYKNMQVNFHEANLDATVDLTSQDGFTLKDMDVNMEESAVAQAFPDVSMAFPVEVKFCADDTTTIDKPPKVISQGFPIQLCAYLKDRETVNNVYVVNVQTLQYWSSQMPADVATPIVGGVPNAVTELDCQQKQGVCRMKWLPMAKYFLDAQLENRLVVGGMAVIAFSDPPTAGRQRNRRRLVRVPITGAIADDQYNKPRSMQESVDTTSNGGGVSVMQQDLGSLRPKRRKNRNKSNADCAATSLLTALVLPAILGAMGLCL